MHFKGLVNDIQKALKRAFKMRLKCILKAAGTMLDHEKHDFIEYGKQVQHSPTEEASHSKVRRESKMYALDAAQALGGFGRL